jgi:general secretion pathway protein A
MYESFYGFREKPFSILPDPAFLFLSQKHRMALSMLEYGLTGQTSFTVVTGEIGSGKTTLVRKLLQEIDAEITVGLVSNTQCSSFEELFRWILFAFELEYRGKDKVELYHTFTDFLIKEYGLSRRVVLIIDEAQNLGPEPLEQLRMLSNVNAYKHQVLQLILVGQPNLRDLLRCPELEQFAQRIGVDYHLNPLDKGETIDYIHHRLSVAGGDRNLFSTEACALIWRHSRGIPRLVNILCDMALVYGFAEQELHIREELIRDVVRDKQMGLTPLREEQTPQGDQALSNLTTGTEHRRDGFLAEEVNHLSTNETSSNGKSQVPSVQRKEPGEIDEAPKSDELSTIERLNARLKFKN